MKLIDFLGDWTIVEGDEPAADTFRHLRVGRVRIGTQDLKIAALAIIHDALLLSANLRDRRTGEVFEGARESIVLKRAGVRVGLFALIVVRLFRQRRPLSTGKLLVCGLLLSSFIWFHALKYLVLVAPLERVLVLYEELIERLARQGLDVAAERAQAADLRRQAAETPFNPTDTVLVGNELFVADGYGANYISAADVTTQRWTRIFGGKGDSPGIDGKFTTAHGINRSPAGQHLVIADRPNARIQHHGLDGHFLASHKLPAGAWPCGIDFIEHEGRGYQPPCHAHLGLVVLEHQRTEGPGQGFREESAHADARHDADARSDCRARGACRPLPARRSAVVFHAARVARECGGFPAPGSGAQQILGSSRPRGKSTSRRPPIRVSRTTRPGPSAVIPPAIAACAPVG